jgi:hypothetical protein
MVSVTLRPLLHRERTPGTDWVGDYVGPRTGQIPVHYAMKYGGLAVQINFFLISALV